MKQLKVAFKRKSQYSRLGAVREAFDHLSMFLFISDESKEEVYADYIRDGRAEFTCNAPFTDGREIPILIKIGKPTSPQKGRKQ